MSERTYEAGHAKLHNDFSGACRKSGIEGETQARCQAIISRVLNVVSHDPGSSNAETELANVSSAMQAVGLGRALADITQSRVRAFAEGQHLTAQR